MAGRRRSPTCRPSRPRTMARPRAYDTGWQQQLFEAGYAGINWPKEFGGRGATLTEQLIYLEETTLAGAPYVGVNFVGLMHAGPTIMAEASAEQKAAAPPHDPQRRGGLVPGVLRARRRFRPRVAVVQGRARRRRVRRHRPEDLDLVRPGRRLRASCWCAPIPTRQAQGHHVADLPDGHARASRSARSRPSSAPPSSPRCSSTRPASRSPTASATRTTAGASPWSRSASSGAPAFISDLVETNRMIAELVELARTSPVASGTAWDDAELRREVGRAAGRDGRAVGHDQAQPGPGRAQRRARVRRLGREGVLLRAVPAHHRPGHAHARSRGAVPRRPRRSRLRARSSRSACARRRSRSPPAPARSSATSSPSASSASRRS